jgi:hypothetical protein
MNLWSIINFAATGDAVLFASLEDGRLHRAFLKLRTCPRSFGSL